MCVPVYLCLFVSGMSVCGESLCVTGDMYVCMFLEVLEKSPEERQHVVIRET